jgi:hypothetical protein
MDLFTECFRGVNEPYVNLYDTLQPLKLIIVVSVNESVFAPEVI